MSKQFFILYKNYKFFHFWYVIAKTDTWFWKTWKPMQDVAFCCYYWRCLPVFEFFLYALTLLGNWTTLLNHLAALFHFLCHIQNWAEQNIKPCYIFAVCFRSWSIMILVICVMQWRKEKENNHTINYDYKLNLNMNGHDIENCTEELWVEVYI